jgi:hypothetical protein
MIDLLHRMDHAPIWVWRNYKSQGCDNYVTRMWHISQAMHIRLANNLVPEWELL